MPSKKILSQELKLELLNRKRDEITVSWIVALFSKTTVKEAGKFIIRQPVINVNDIVNLKAGECTNKKDITTTAGRILFNRILIEGNIEEIIPDGFINEQLSAKKMKGIFDIVSKAILDEKILIKPNVINFINAYEFWGLKLVAIFSPSLNMNMLKPDPKIMEEKKKLINNLDKNASISDMTNIEDKLIAKARAEKKDDPAMSLFDSGARGDFEDNYKNISIGIGPVLNNTTGKYDFVESNYMEGFKKKDIPAIANLVVNSAYPKAVGTQKGGYLTKQFYAVYQSIQIEPNSDCGTTRGLEITLTPSIIALFHYQYIITDKRLVLLTPENDKDFVNKTVKLRSPMYCISDKICSICAGTRLEQLGITNIGLVTGRISNTLLNKRMKSWHITKVALNEVDPDKLLL